ncbi:hypothetical protein JYU34_018382 [Plutella xylostella]|uniref:Uncharacterized protein n=1 Tax=Plutella xylostella TaxID=51655 RepID=A0ABQ7PXF7_PLUXY|nr:hypothetical protein JYU34_018382 [Plutella xylostella]
MASCRVITIAACLLAALASVECVDHVMYHDPLHHQLMGYPIPAGAPVLNPRFSRLNREYRGGDGVPRGGDGRARRWRETAIFSVERDSRGRVVSMRQEKPIPRPLVERPIPRPLVERPIRRPLLQRPIHRQLLEKPIYSPLICGQ